MTKANLEHPSRRFERGHRQSALPPDGPPRGLRAWAAKHPVTAFLVLLFGIGYPVMSLPIMAGHGVIPGGWLPQRLGLDTERSAALLLVYLALLPVTLWVTWAADGRDGLRALLRRMFRWRFPARWWVAILVGLPTLTIALALMLGDTTASIDVTSVVVEQTVGLLVGLLLVNLWEETAWAGFLQTRLEGRHNIFTAAALTAVPFALIHMPLQFIGDFSVGSLVAGLVLLLVIGVVFRLLLGVVLRGTRDSVLAAALMHTVFNRSNNSDGIGAALLDGEAHQLAALAATVVFTVVLAIVNRRRLTRGYRLAPTPMPQPE